MAEKITSKLQGKQNENFLVFQQNISVYEMTEDEMNVPKGNICTKKCGFSSRLYCECNDTSAGKMYLQKEYK
jgi:hypothetical protein